MLTTKQLQEWEVYDHLDPIGTWRSDYRFATLQTLILNIVSKLYSKKGHKPELVEVQEMMPKWYKEDEVEEKQSVDQMKGMFSMLSKINFGGKKKQIKKK